MELCIMKSIYGRINLPFQCAYRNGNVFLSYGVAIGGIKLPFLGGPPPPPIPKPFTNYQHPCIFDSIYGIFILWTKAK
jgi:hypothetical protein